MDEFSLIRRYFSGLTALPEDVVLGIGDDCALLQPPSRGEELAITTDTLIAGRHFPLRTAAFDIGWKALAVNLSDLAAMGAQPRWFTLALALPEAREDWLQGFAAGLKAVADGVGIALVGGDTTRGPLSISITALGVVPAGQALRRAGAQPGDLVCVTGSLGDAALALRLLAEQDLDDYDHAVAPLEQDRLVGSLAAALRRGRNFTVLPPLPHLAVPATRDAEPQPSPDLEVAFLRGRLNRPEARLQAGAALRAYAHAAIDISDGLAGDLTHVLEASGVGAEIETDRLPMSPSFASMHPRAERLRLQASGGDDYELCVCLPKSALEEARAALQGLPLTPVGRIVAAHGLRWLDAAGRTVEGPPQGYRHFDV